MGLENKFASFFENGSNDFHRTQYFISINANLEVHHQKNDGRLSRKRKNNTSVLLKMFLTDNN
jgi:hypothetical protein